MSSFERLAYTSSRVRMDWKVSYDKGLIDPDRRYRLKLAQLVNKIGMRTDGSTTSELYLPPISLRELLLRIIYLPYHIFLVGKIGSIQFVAREFPLISQKNREMCEKFYILGAINSIWDER